MKYFRKYLALILVIILIFITVFIWYFVLNETKNEPYLKVVFLDVGQGDAIYIEAPNKKQILIDAGPGSKVLSSLSKVMPFSDRTIDIVMATHPDKDHIGGMSYILENYKIENFIETGAFSSSEIYRDLDEIINKKKIKRLIAKRGMHIVLDKDKNIYLDILFPDRSVSELESNDSSIVGKLTYNNNSFMFTGDATLYTENIIDWNENSNLLKSNILKLGHHGSRTSSGVLWLKKINPEIAIISAGKNNSYGHPHKEVIDRLNSLNITYLNTIDLGNILIKSDGINFSY